MEEAKTTWVRVYNDMQDLNLTVHWHGLSQRTAPFSDGTPQVSQWPIPPHYFFDHAIQPLVGDAGSYFYHSHVGFQAISAAGPLIVKNCAQNPSPYNYSSDLIVQLGDFYNMTDSVIEAGLIANPFVWSNETNAILFNGQSGTADSHNATDPSCMPHVISVEPATTYRLRFIGATAISLVTLGIEEHSNLTIIEADGGLTSPFSVDHLQVASGQRFSVLLTTKSVAELGELGGKSQFWIQYENRGRPANISGYALLQYNLAPTAPSSKISLPTKAPLTLPQQFINWLEYSLTPYPGPDPLSTSNLSPPATDYPPASSVSRTVVITVKQVIDGSIHWADNNNTWTQARTQTPYLVSIYMNNASAVPNYAAAVANGGWDPANLAFAAEINETIDVVWQNDNGPSGGWDIHPFHAHGGHYWDLGSGNGTYNATANEALLAQLYAQRGYVPVKRDTTMLYRYATAGEPNTTAGWRAWRLQVQDAGVWMMHCHILQHMIMGMQTVWVFGDAADITSQIPEPYVAGYLDYGGSAFGNATYDPLVYHYFS